MCPVLFQGLPALRRAAIAALLFYTACSPSLPPPSKTEQEAFEALSSIEMDGILNAFRELSVWSYTRHDFTENRGVQEYEFAVQLVHTDSSGSAVVIAGSDSAAVADWSEIVEAMMPGDAPYLAERFRDDFLYQIREDTSYWSRPAGAIIIKSRPGSGQDIMEASYLYDDASRALVSASFHKYNRTILFEELSRYRLQLRPAGTVWVPYRLITHVTLRLPSGQQQVFARNVTFYNYIARAGS